MESFHHGQKEDPMGEKHGSRISRILSSRVSHQSEIRTAKVLDLTLRRAFPDVIIKTHPQPKKK